MICMTLFFMISFMLGACSLNEDAALLYKQETPLEYEFILPPSYSDHQEEIIKVILTQGGERVKDPDFVHFEIWKQDGSVYYSMEAAKDLGNGTFSISKDFDSDGLYFVKGHAGKNGSIIMPQNQFIVG
ncbi:FixH family protein [Bacillus sp. SA1-12]|uniref:FixH family protein n=1 Tax=Bacillus sp. SA1-12 TaxID=1455638 RepID=UPI001E5ABAE0|nr:FixH family protein [Bacillus sp. SA1-12]